MTRKPFDEELFRENDRRARAAVLRYTSGEGVYVIENDDLYGPDLVVYTGYRPSSYIEVEIKRVWKETEDMFPWVSVQLPERKAKYLRKRLPIEYWILRTDCKMAVIIPDYALASCSPVEVPNVEVSSGEKFFQVPLEQCSVVKFRD